MSKTLSTDELIKLTDPKTFTRKLLELAKNDPPVAGKGSTTWFETLMQKFAETPKLYCQNLQACIRGEWMKLDHVFVNENTYNDFPLIVVEHENGNISRSTARGQVPHGEEKGTYIEWAAWKALAVQARLHVVVAYPWEKDRNAVLKVFSEIVQSHYNLYERVPNALFLLGWWTRTKEPRMTWAVRDLTHAYVPRLSKDTITLVPLSRGEEESSPRP